MSEIDLRSIFFPNLLERVEGVREKGTRFVHYTSADVGISIIKTGEIWMRNSSCMNDYSEMSFGINCVTKFFNSAEANPMWTVLNRIQEGLSDEIKNLFDGWSQDVRRHTYLTCLSEHMDAEDGIGRLSMWRAYGKNGGVALVLNQEAMMSETDILKAYTYPVHYYNDEEITEFFIEVVSGIQQHLSGLSSRSVEGIKGTVFYMLQTYCICLKHPGFAEEKEWRVVYRPNQVESDVIKKSVETVNGVPQRIYKIPLEDVPQEGSTGRGIDGLLNKIIIGPTEHPFAVADAYVEALTEAGVNNPEARVVISEIPLRT
ncbi:MAG: DUF2971 domain-containing protein [Emcibacter sp.]|nr:DUF2971 domain-containing protein [Emcibacter sp.]MBL4895105.1 DUF2971 domain-containing protein [Emcibacter sp.]